MKNYGFKMEKGLKYDEKRDFNGFAGCPLNSIPPYLPANPLFSPSLFRNRALTGCEHFGNGLW